MFTKDDIVRAIGQSIQYKYLCDHPHDDKYMIVVPIERGGFYPAAYVVLKNKWQLVPKVLVPGQRYDGCGEHSLIYLAPHPYNATLGIFMTTNQGLRIYGLDRVR